MNDRNKDEKPEEYGERKVRTNYMLPLPPSPVMKVLSSREAATSGVEFRCK